MAVVNISGSFTYEPVSPIGQTGLFDVALIVVDDAGNPAAYGQTIGLTVVLSYPGFPDASWPLDIVNIDDSGNGLVRVQASFPSGANPGQDWLPAALAVSLDRVFLAVITAAPPAPADSGWSIVRPVGGQEARGPASG
jgi:hypothetical protein